MKRTHYIVIHALDRWWIDREGKAYGPFDSQAEAVAAGPQFIMLMGEESHINQLYCADETGKFSIIWSNAAAQNDPG